MKNDVFWDLSNFDDELRSFTLPPPSDIAEKRVIVITCGAAGILRSGQYKFYHELEKAKAKQSGGERLVGIEFSHILIDEAGQVHADPEPAIYTWAQLLFLSSLFGSCSGINDNHGPHYSYYQSLPIRDIKNDLQKLELLGGW